MRSTSLTMSNDINMVLKGRTRKKKKESGWKQDALEKNVNEIDEREYNK